MAETAERTGCRVFTLVDEAVSAPQIRRLAASLLEQGHDFTWDALVRLEEKLDRETLDLAYRSGMRAIYFGLETGSQKVMDLMRTNLAELNESQDALRAELRECSQIARDTANEQLSARLEGLVERADEFEAKLAGFLHSAAPPEKAAEIEHVH